MLLSPIPRRSVSREPVSRMQLVFDEEDDGGQEMEAAAADPRTSRGTEERRSGGATAAEEEAAGPPAASWGLGELLCVCLSLCIFFSAAANTSWEDEARPSLRRPLGTVGHINRSPVEATRLFSSMNLHFNSDCLSGSGCSRAVSPSSEAEVLKLDTPEQRSTVKCSVM